MKFITVALALTTFAASAPAPQQGQNVASIPRYIAQPRAATNQRTSGQGRVYDSWIGSNFNWGCPAWRF
ncbi:hypothetical protein AX774_g2514 [Zancudomyces culisetae]|uniref:Uncharacterized protein n=1 Tax=Zancudomyces culisetae TaxID=1213189 RepID=A0A1R1PSM8_ZANCU|nr:hypothetical protein AX774_g2514 [Zancudomyces culisetae]|eukprot:OMH83967.1 hypothetical protein AX774_g2514 [Zancudomyces culisetae]